MAIKKRHNFDMLHVATHQQFQQQHSKARLAKHLTTESQKRPKLTLMQSGAIGKWFSESFRNYCQTTSLHGFNYFTRKDISQRERTFWIVIVIIAIIVSVALVVVSWLWKRATPTVTVIESSHFPTWNIPFPAVTICNLNKISRTRAMNQMDSMQLPPNATREVLYRLFNATLYPDTSTYSTEELADYDKILKINNLTFAELKERISPNCLDMIIRCIWKGMSIRCEGLFQRILTMEGFCCSFNYFAAVTNNFPEKIAYQIPKRPFRVTGCGYPTGLSVLLNPMAADYYGTFFSSFGFRLLIHDAFNYPDENAETRVVTSKRESFVRISPETTYATNDIRSMDLKLRNCLFGSERRLPMMHRYSFINCMFQCRIRMMFKKCGCLPANVPNNGSYPICDVLQTNCVISTKRIFSYALANLNASLTIVRDTHSFPCGCLPDCQSNHYVSEITMGRLNVNFARNIISESSNHTDNVLLHVFFSDLMSTRYRMEIFQNWLSALASFGGLLGLIMGFSIVTAFEFLYFLTFRPVFNYFNRD